MKLKHIIILQNKIDLVQPSQAAAQCEQIRSFVSGTVADGAPILPISAQLQYLLLLAVTLLKIPPPLRDFTSSPQLIVIRSFDVNKPGAEADELQGGVAGGSILRGILKLGQEIEILPGIIKKSSNGGIRCQPILSKITSLFAEKNTLQYAVPGGLIGVGTNIDPTLTRADRLVGQVLGEVGKLPDVYIQLEISFFLLRKLLGVRSDSSSTTSAKDSSSKSSSKKKTKIKPLDKNEVLMVNIGSTSTGGRVIATKKDLARIHLTSPCCTYPGAKLALSRRVDKHWRLIGWGNVLKGVLLNKKQ